MTNDSRVSSLAEQLRSLLPLQEEHVEAFDALVSQLAEHGGTQAAAELLLALDDQCPLGGVMVGLAGGLPEFKPDELIPALFATLPITTLRAPHAVRTVMRGVLLSDAHRERLKADVADLDAARRSMLRQHLEAVGRFDKYRNRCAEVIGQLS